jgi:membrane-associated phospholipid phosphatase
MVVPDTDATGVAKPSGHAPAAATVRAVPSLAVPIMVR